GPGVGRRCRARATGAAEPQYIGSGGLFGLAVDGDVAWIEDDMFGVLAAYDLTDPTQPTEIARLMLPPVEGLAFGRKLIAEQGLAIVSRGEAGGVLVDISTPEAPAIVATLPAESDNARFALDRDVGLAWSIEQGSEGSLLCQYGIADPSDPQALGCQELEGISARTIVPHDGEVLLGGDSLSRWHPGGATVFARWVLEGQTVSITQDMAWHGATQRLAMGRGLVGATVYDLPGVDPPSAPTFVVGGLKADHVLVDAQRIVVAEAADLWSIPLDTVTSSSPQPATPTGALFTWDIHVDGPWAWLALNGALGVMDIASQQEPTVVATAPAEGIATGVHVADQVAWLASDQVYTFDVSSPMEPVLLGSYATFNSTDVRVQGDRAFVLAKEEGVLVLDAQTPEAPPLLERLPLQGRWPIDIALTEDLLIVSHGGSVSLFDISDPNATEQLAVIDAFLDPMLAQGLALDAERNLLYVADGSDDEPALRTYDLTSPEQPVLISHVPSPWPLTHVLRLGANGLIYGLSSSGVAIFEHVEGGRLAPRGFQSTAFESLGEALGLSVDADGSAWAAVKYAGVSQVRILEGTWDEDYVQVAPGQVLTWTARGWTPGYGLSCASTAGACEVILGPEGQEATVRWTAPPDPGDHEVGLVVGNLDDYQIVARDQVFVR
ncbi:MAG: hypothetical protein AAFS10_03145, partial [Myxococcota bacterium]